MAETKGIVKQCPTCKQPMSLAKFEVVVFSGYYWICETCPQMIDYQSVEASELKEIEV